MQPATRFGPYEIIRRLGKSMNDVYLARDTRGDRQTALKLIRPGSDAVSRLVLEAERRGAAIQQQLHSLDPRMIEVYDYGDLDNGYFFVAMQYVEGRSLAETLTRDGRMDPYRAAHIAMEICGQLDKFHGFQPGDGTTTAVVHGDIKPSNIHLGPNETVRLLDFGIAKALRPDSDFTLHNFGSPSYCSPERLGRSQVDQQADLWGVGVTLYEMVAGSPPYQAEDTRKLEKLIQSGRPPRSLPVDCPRGLRAIISKALAHDVDRRYASAAAFAADLNAFLTSGEILAETEKRRPWFPNPTLESARTSSAPTPRRKLRRPRRALRTAAQTAIAVACVITGMLVFIATSYFWRFWTASRQLEANLDYTQRPLTEINADWSLYKDLQRQFGFLRDYTPVARLRAPLRMAYAQAGERLLDSYDRGSDPALRHYDWQKAELCWSRAADLGATDADTTARLALSHAYVTMLRIMDWKGSDRTELESLRQQVRDRFEDAAKRSAQWPDPHLGLARIYLYSMPDPARALDELATAERLGYRLGPREIEQRADAFRLRGFDDLHANDLAGARKDFAESLHLYRSIAGFSLADYHAQQIPEFHMQPPPAPHPIPKHKPRPHRWR